MNRRSPVAIVARLLAPALFAGSLAVGAVGCGKEVGRIGLSGEGEGDASATLKAGQKVALWTKLDVSWDGTFAAHYDVELRDAAAKAVASASCDPLDVGTKLGSVETTLGAHHSKSYSGKMRCELVAPANGTYTVHAKLRYDTKPATLSVKDMSLVLKL